mmetsp:Transcript_15895/g.27032  ORF Transcript_15895/g.27032 Transcript_15895/m.27032 type:complete len:232 (+) Transcript_15895:114-809(+)
MSEATILRQMGWYASLLAAKVPTASSLAPGMGASSNSRNKGRTNFMRPWLTKKSAAGLRMPGRPALRLRRHHLKSSSLFCLELRPYNSSNRTSDALGTAVPVASPALSNSCRKSCCCKEGHAEKSCRGAAASTAGEPSAKSLASSLTGSMRLRSYLGSTGGMPSFKNHPSQSTLLVTSGWEFSKCCVKYSRNTWLVIGLAAKSSTYLRKNAWNACLPTPCCKCNSKFMPRS